MYYCNSLLAGLPPILISCSLFSTQDPKCSFLKHRSNLVTPLLIILHGFPISEYNLKSLEWLPRPCVNRLSLHFLISSPNILSLSTPLQPPRPPCWSKSSQAHSHSGPVHLLSFLLKWSSTSYLQLLLDLSKSFLRCPHNKKPNVALLPCLAFFVFMVQITLPVSPHIYLLLLV